MTWQVLKKRLAKHSLNLIKLKMKYSYLKSTVGFIFFLSILSCETKQVNMNAIPKNAIIRISIGYYPPEKAPLVEEKLQTIFKEKIEPAVKKLEGNINYFVAIDTEKNSITNVSLWESKSAAMQMAEMVEMKEMGRDFVAMGVEFTDITNHKMLWQLP